MQLLLMTPVGLTYIYSNKKEPISSPYFAWYFGFYERIIMSVSTVFGLSPLRFFVT